MDGIVQDAIANGNSASGLKAREMCAEAARKRMEQIREMEGDDGEKKVAGGLSVEAVTAHTQGASKFYFFFFFLDMETSMIMESKLISKNLIS